MRQDGRSVTSSNTMQPDSSEVLDTTTYFSGLADVYDAHRPSYPREAIDAAMAGLPQSVRVADIGCGTGISSRLLADTGAIVVGVDPNEDMLTQARSATPADQTGSTYRCAPAESTGLDADSFDLVVCAQSFHWFEVDDALREFKRILRAEGRLALIWNVRSQDNAFGEGYESIVNRARADAISHGRVLRRGYAYDPTSSSHFTNRRTLIFPNHHVMDWPSLLGRARSASYFPREGSVRMELERDLRATFDAHSRDGTITLRQRTEVTLADVVKS